MSIEINITDNIVEVTPTEQKVDINITENPIEVNVTDEIVLIAQTGLQGPAGPAGPGVAIGGTTGQILAKNSATNYDTVWIDNKIGTVTSIDASGISGISVSGGPITSSGTLLITNTAPDQIVSLTGAGTSSVSGTYPNFTITSNDQYTGTVSSVNASGGTGISVSGGPITSSGTLTITNTAPDQIVSLTGTGTTSISGTYPSFTINSADQYIGTVTSVGLSMPSAFNVANSPITGSGSLNVTGAGTASQYIRGDGTLATFPSTSSGGSSVYYYFNGSVNASVSGYKQLANSAVVGAGTDFSIVGNGLIAQFLTDAGNPNRVLIPGGAWNIELFFSASSAGGGQKYYVDLLKYNGTTFTLIASNSTNPEEITGGTATDLYLTSIAVPETILLTTDRLAMRVYIVDNSSGRTITLHTEDNNLCQIITTFAGGVSSLNGLTANTQYLATGTSGTDFNISSATDTHTFNLPTASATNRGALSSTDWSTFNSKQGAITLTTTGTSGASTLIGNTLNIPQYSGTNIYNADGTLTSARTLTHGGFNFSLVGSSFTNRFTSAGRLLLGTTTESTFILDVVGTARISQDLTARSCLATGANAINTGSYLGLEFFGTRSRITSYNWSTSQWVPITLGGARLIFADSLGSRTEDLVGKSASFSGNVKFLSNLTYFGPNENAAIAAYGTFSDANFPAIESNSMGLFNDYFGATKPIFFVCSKINFQIGTGANSKVAQFSPTTGNFILQNGGTFTDSGQRLQVTGTSLFTGVSTISASPATGGNVVILKNNNTTGEVSSVIGLDTTATSAIADIRLASTNPVGIRMYASESALTATPIGAGFQFYRITHPTFPGAVFFDSGSHNNAALIFRTAITSGTITERMRIFSSGNILMQNGGTFTDSGFRLDVNGTARVQGAISSTVSGAAVSLSAYNPVINYPGAVFSIGNSSSDNSATLYVIPTFATGTAQIPSQISISTNATVTQASSKQIILYQTNTDAYLATALASNGSTSATPIRLAAGFNTTNMKLYTNGNTTVGDNVADITSSIFSITSTTKGFLPPRMTSTQRTAIATPAAGLMVYDTTLNKLCVYTTAWETITSA